MKIAPLYHALSLESWCEPQIVHTGQHYDTNMSGSFFEDLLLPEPHFHLGVGSGTHAEQTAGVMVAYEGLALEEKPDLVIVVGDVNSTIACALAAKKIHIPVAHLEAGLRSNDRTMPEEINRILTDSIADILWTPSIDGNENLLREGVSVDKIEFVGNIMIDSLEMMRDSITENEDADEILETVNRPYALVTLHRPSNVDDKEQLENLLRSFSATAGEMDLIFPLHPRTRKNLEEFGFLQDLIDHPNIHVLEPLNYLAFMKLVMHAKLLITDSGGIQEETTHLNVPCLTLRNNTERPITITQGTNQLVTTLDLRENIKGILNGDWKETQKIQHWDGKTAHRIAKKLKARFAPEAKQAATSANTPSKEKLPVSGS